MLIVMPELIVKVEKLCQAGKFAEAVASQKQANDIIEPLIAAHGVASTKQILVWQGLLDHANCVYPRAGLTEQQQTDLRKRLATTAIGDTLGRG